MTFKVKIHRIFSFFVIFILFANFFSPILTTFSKNIFDSNVSTKYFQEEFCSNDLFITQQNQYFVAKDYYNSFAIFKGILKSLDLKNTFLFIQFGQQKFYSINLHISFLQISQENSIRGPPIV